MEIKKGGVKEGLGFLKEVFKVSNNNGIVRQGVKEQNVGRRGLGGG